MTDEANKGGAGTPSDVLDAFASALVSAAKVPGDTSEPHVAAAFALGWQMAELHNPTRRRRSARVDGDLPGLGSLDDRQRLGILVDQIQATLAKLVGAIEKAGLDEIKVDVVRASLGTADLPANVLALHLQLLGELIATDFRYGKAYGLGRALADTCLKPADLATVREGLDVHRIANLRNWLDELSSALPTHAAHSVSASLGKWTAWATSAGAADETDALPALRRQGELWRALLSGEKRGSDLLEIDNYLEAADQAATEMKRISWQALLRFRGLALVALVFLLAGIGLLIWGGGSQDVAAAGSLLAALGLTWKGLGGALGQLAGKLEAPIWGGVLDTAIADAITLLPDSTHDHAGRRKLAVQAAAAHPGAASS